MDINTVAKQFIDFYYSTFSTNRGNLRNLYRAESMLTFEGTPFKGADAIHEKLTSLTFQKVLHKVTTHDVQPASPEISNRNILVLVTGLLVVDDSPNPLQFTQIFHLVPDGSSYYVLNDAFRLICA